MLAEGERSQQYGLHYTLISGHPSSCPLCVPWQGAVLIDDVFSNGKPDGKTPLLSQAINDGLYHYNCRHTRTVFVPGVDNAKLFDKDIASPEETAKRYAIEQQQRYNERKIREWKRREAASLGNKEQSLARVKILEWQAQQRTLRDIAEKEGIPFYRQYSREQIGGETRPAISIHWSKSSAENKNFSENRFNIFYNNVIEKEKAITNDLIATTEKTTDGKLEGLEFSKKDINSTKRKLELIISSEKITQAEAEDKLYDIIRYTQISNSEKLYENYRNTVDDLDKKGYTLIEVKNTWQDPLNPYKGINAKFLDNRGQKFELQFHTEESFIMKQEIHKYYEEYRALDKSSPRAKQLSKIMFKKSKELSTPKDINKI